MVILVKTPFILRLFKGSLRRLLRSFIDRAFERGYLNSSAYHSLHAMANRAFY